VVEEGVYRPAEEFPESIGTLHAPQKITMLDMVKRPMGFGFHPSTIDSPLVVPGAIMLDPTETETLAEIDHFTEAF